MKPIVKTLIIVGISAFAVIVGIVLIVVLNRILKKANDAKRRNIRQQQRQEINQMLQYDLEDERQEKNNIHKNIPPVIEPVKSEPIPKQKTKEELVEEWMNSKGKGNPIVKPIEKPIDKLIDKPTKSIVKPIEKLTPIDKKNKMKKNLPQISEEKPENKIKKKRNHKIENVNRNFLQSTESDFEIISEQLCLNKILSETQLKNVKEKKPKDLIELMKLIKEEINNEKVKLNQDLKRDLSDNNTGSFQSEAKDSETNANKTTQSNDTIQIEQSNRERTARRQQHQSNIMNALLRLGIIPVPLVQINEDLRRRPEVIEDDSDDHPRIVVESEVSMNEDDEMETIIEEQNSIPEKRIETVIENPNVVENSNATKDSEDQPRMILEPKPSMNIDDQAKDKSKNEIILLDYDSTNTAEEDFDSNDDGSPQPVVKNDEHSNLVESEMIETGLEVKSLDGKQKDELL